MKVEKASYHGKQEIYSTEAIYLYTEAIYLCKAEIYFDDPSFYLWIYHETFVSWVRQIPSPSPASACSRCLAEENFAPSVCPTVPESDPEHPDPPAYHFVFCRITGQNPGIGPDICCCISDHSSCPPQENKQVLEEFWDLFLALEEF